MYTPDKLAEILAAHREWRMDSRKGKHADLRGANLRYANLQGADLRDANLQDANLQDADLQDADLRGANLRYAYLRGAYLQGAYLQGADLRGANLRYANLQGADLQGADLRGAYLPAFLIVPQQGAFIAWKKASGVVVKLEIPADAKRCNSLVGRKCRAEFVRVLAIDGDTTAGKSVAGSHDPSTVYTVDETTRADSYDDDIRIECTHGIHFFITKDEAEQW